MNVDTPPQSPREVTCPGAPKKKNLVSKKECSGCRDFRLYGRGENQEAHMDTGGCRELKFWSAD